MKKYIFSVFAIVLAIAISSFTKPTTTSKIFVYSPSTSTYTKAAVEDEANWILTTVSCDQEAQQLACSIEIEIPAGQESNFYNTSTGRLIPESGGIGVTIVASLWKAFRAFVADVLRSGASVVNDLANKIDPNP